MTTGEGLTGRQRQSQQTQGRLLAAAFDEFQRHGLAGGRVDRIAKAAGANKRLIYVYFGDKEGLFDAVVEAHVATMIDAVPFEISDLPGTASRLFDYLEERPEVLRLFQWRNLERRTASAAEQASYQRKIEGLQAAQRDGRVDARIPAPLLLAQVLAATVSWASASPALDMVAADLVTPETRRDGVRESVARLVVHTPAAET